MLKLPPSFFLFLFLIFLFFSSSPNDPPLPSPNDPLGQSPRFSDASDPRDFPVDRISILLGKLKCSCFGGKEGEGGCRSELGGCLGDGEGGGTRGRMAREGLFDDFLIYLICLFVCLR